MCFRDLTSTCVLLHQASAADAPAPTTRAVVTRVRGGVGGSMIRMVFIFKSFSEEGREVSPKQGW